MEGLSREPGDEVEALQRGPLRRALTVRGRIHLMLMALPRKREAGVSGPLACLCAVGGPRVSGLAAGLPGGGGARRAP